MLRRAIFNLIHVLPVRRARVLGVLSIGRRDLFFSKNGYGQSDRDGSPTVRLHKM
jgi:hypothetical protein